MYLHFSTDSFYSPIGALFGRSTIGKTRLAALWMQIKESATSSNGHIPFATVSPGKKREEENRNQVGKRKKKDFVLRRIKKDHHHHVLEGGASTLPSGIIVSLKSQEKKKSPQFSDSPTKHTQKNRNLRLYLHWKKKNGGGQLSITRGQFLPRYIGSEQRKRMTRIYVPSNTSLLATLASDLIVHDARGIHFQCN